MAKIEFFLGGKKILLFMKGAVKSLCVQTLTA